MKKFESFLFFYGICAITIVMIAFGVFSPSPLNLISGALLSPIIFYFWIRLTSPENLAPDKWSVRLLIVIILVTAAGIFGFYLKSMVIPQIQALKAEVVISQNAASKSASDLNLANDQLLKMRQAAASPSGVIKGVSTLNTSITDLITATPSADSTQRITGLPGVDSIDVYQNPDLTSPKIGTLIGSIKYPYITKQDGWYKIVMTSTQTGWVSTTQVTE